MGREFEDSKVCYIRFKYYRRSRASVSMGARAQVDNWAVDLDVDADVNSDIPEPSSSRLLKQLSIMRRFSSSNRSARLMPGADMLSSPSGRSPILSGPNRCCRVSERRGTEGVTVDQKYSRTKA